MRIPRTILPLFLASAAGAEVAPNPLFSDGAILQRDRPVPVWGTSTREGEAVTVSYGGNSVSTTSAGGRWRVELPALHETPEGDSHRLVIRGDNTVVASDVLLGEVWVCSGQSNMEWKLNSTRGDTTASRARDPHLRMLTVRQGVADAPAATAPSSGWRRTAPDTAGAFSAVAYHFGRELRARLKVPVGLIVSAWGGTQAEAWTELGTLESLPEGRAAIARYPATLAEYGKQVSAVAEWEAAARSAQAGGAPPPPRPPEPDHGLARSRPGGLYNAMLHPLIPYGMRGVIWYQGEANSPRAREYSVLFPAMIANWRARWGLGDFPFLYVQITPFRRMNPGIREAQRLSLGRAVNTAMTVTTDVGEADNIHPPKKAEVGRRLALAARALAYGEKIEFSGPLFAGVSFAEGRAEVRFSHAAGLASRDGGPLRGFELADAAGRFYPAKAEIHGDVVTVTSEKVSAPAAVRYGWASAPDVNLVNGAGLPASPFRSDAL